MTLILLLLFALSAGVTPCVPGAVDGGSCAPEFSQVRKAVPAAPPLEGIYPPMSSRTGPRWDYLKSQYRWYARQAPANNEGVRGGGNGEAWRYDPVKTLIEICRRARLVGEDIEGICQDAKDSALEFLKRQHWGSHGTYPDCSGGLTGITRGNRLADKCDFKYGGHASVFHYAKSVYGLAPYSEDQIELMKAYCYSQGWGYGWIEVDGMEDGFTERNAGISLQCLVDLHKADVDTRRELSDALEKLHAMFTGDASGKVIGAPMHSLNGHECGNSCDDMDYWMFSPWMGSAFLIPALWEYWVFVDQDPRVAQMIVMFGDALLAYGIVDPEKWAPGKGPWRQSRNPTPWVTLYFALPYDKATNIRLQDGDGWYSDLHNPEAIFALSAAWFFSCNPVFKRRVDDMLPYFTGATAADPGANSRVFLWQHRGSASTEWLLENAACGPPETVP